MPTRFLTTTGYRRAPVSDATSFDGHLFSDHNIVIERIHDNLPSMRETLSENVGRHGSSLRGLYMSPREITLECRIFHDRWDDFESAMQDVYAWLVTSEDKWLKLRNRPGQHYLAHLTSCEEDERSFDNTSFTLNFTASDPLRYADDERVLVAKKDEKTQFEVGGTDEAQLVIDVNSQSGVNHANVFLTRGESSSDVGWLVLMRETGLYKVTYDCVNHRVFSKTDGGSYIEEISNPLGLDLNARWPIFTPGKWTVLSTDGTATLTWRESCR